MGRNKMLLTMVTAAALFGAQACGVAPGDVGTTTTTTVHSTTTTTSSGGAGSGDATVGATLYGGNGCAGCHGTNGGNGTVESIRGLSAGEVADALQHGRNEDGLTMPSYPSLVSHANDIAAFLGGSAGSGTTTTTVSTTTTTAAPSTGTTTTTLTTTTTTLAATPNAANGGTVFAANGCTGCHGATGAGGVNIRMRSASVVANALQNGIGSMPAFPSLVGSAADIAAFLSQ